MKKSSGKIMLELSRNRIRVSKGHCYLGKHMAKINLELTGDCGLSGAEDESP